jgi:hypothetical protein
MGETCKMHGAVKNPQQIIVRKPEWKKWIGRPRYRWEGKIEMELWEIESEGMGCMQMSQDGIKY